MKGRTASRGQLRIIAGRWRGRRLPILDRPGLRPTPDRVRETLFNWLAPWLPGARCLDLFAGTGALGLEAASRGAASVALVERDAAVARHLEAAVTTLDAADLVTVSCADAQRWLDRPATPADVVFLDPPWTEGGYEAVAERLESGGWLAPEALIHVESDAGSPAPDLPATWHEHRSRVAGQVRYTLMARSAAN